MALAASGQEVMAATMLVIAELRQSGNGLARELDDSELTSIVTSAVVKAEASYDESRGDLFDWLVGKGLWLSRDGLRSELRHRMGLTEKEMHEHEKPRQVVSMDRPVTDDSSAVREPVSTLPLPHEAACHEELRQRLERALDKFPDQRMATAFRLIVWHEWTREDVGELFSLTPGRITQMMTTARHKLRPAFRDLRPPARVA